MVAVDLLAIIGGTSHVDPDAAHNIPDEYEAACHKDHNDDEAHTLGHNLLSVDLIWKCSVVIFWA